MSWYSPSNAKGSLLQKTAALSLRRDPLARAASLIVPRLYLSDYFTATSEADLRRLRITHVVSAIEHTPDFPASMAQQLRVFHVRIADSMAVDILSHLDATTAFIRDALAQSPENRVLVHCFQGISRSVTVVCAYLVATTPMLPVESIAFCQSKRAIACPNLGFRKQLEQYCERLEKRGEKPQKKGLLVKMQSGMGDRIRSLMGPSQVKLKNIAVENP